MLQSCRSPFQELLDSTACCVDKDMYGFLHEEQMDWWVATNLAACGELWRSYDCIHGTSRLSANLWWRKIDLFSVCVYSLSVLLLIMVWHLWTYESLLVEKRSRYMHCNASLSQFNNILLFWALSSIKKKSILRVICKSKAASEIIECNIYYYYHYYFIYFIYFPRGAE